MTRILRSILCGSVCLLAGVSSSQPAALEAARSPLDIAREHEQLVASDLGVLAPGDDPYEETRGIVTYGATDDAWPISFRTGLVPRLENGIPTYPFSVQMDDETGEAVFSNANGTEFYFLPPALPEFASDWLRIRHGLPLFGEIPSYRKLSHVVSRWTLVHDSLAQDLSETRSAPQSLFAPLRKSPIRLSASPTPPNPFQIQAIGLSSGEPIDFTIPFAWREDIVPTNGILDLWSSETLGSRNWSVLASMTAAGSTNHVFSFSETNLSWYVPPLDCPAAHCGCPCCEPVVTTNFVGSVFDPGATNGVWVVATNSTCDCVRGTTSGFFTVFLRRDQDGDGLSDAEEVLNTDTNPFLFDMDGDGLCDADELSSGTNPKNADSDGDGVPDGRDAGEWSSHPYLAWSPENANFAMCRLWPVPPETSSVLWFDDLCLPLVPTQSVWYLRLPETNVVSCRLVLVGHPVLMLDCGPPESIGSWQFPHLPTTLGRTPVWCDNVSGVFTGNDSGGSCRFAVPRLVVSPEGSHCVHSPDGRVPISCTLEPSLCETVLSFEGSGAVSVDGNGPYIALGDRDSVTGTLLTTCAASPFSGPYFWGTFTNTVSAHRCTAGGVGQCFACERVHTPEHACFHETDCSARFHSESNCTCTVFIPIGETVSLRVLGANDCCCDAAADGYDWVERSSSAFLRTCNHQGNLEILSTTNSPSIGGFSVSYEILDESNAVVRAVTISVTSAGISVKPDFSGGYALETQFGPPEERFIENGVWSVARRAEPYPIAFENAIPSDAVLSVSFTAPEDGPMLRTDGGDAVPRDGTPVSSTNFVTRNERRLLYLDASASGHRQATVTYRLSAPDGHVFLSESLVIQTVDTTVGEHVVQGPSSERLTWDYSGITSNVWMGLATDGDGDYTIIEYEEGDRVQVSLDHPIGDYVLEAHFPHVWSGYDSIGMVSGAVHIVHTEIEQDEIRDLKGSAIQQLLCLTETSTQTASWRIFPVLENGARLHVSEDGPGVTFAPGSSAIWLSAGSIATNYTIVAEHPSCHDSRDEIPFRVGNVSMVPDYDFDDEIGSDDIADAATNRIFRFWINNDNDDNDGSADEGEAGMEIPDFGYLHADWSDGIVNGNRDRLDWFPVWLDLTDALSIYPASEYQYSIVQDDEAVAGIWTSLTKSSAGLFQRENILCAGNGFSESVTNAVVARPSDGELAIPVGFLQLISTNSAAGIVLLEGRRISAKPLKLEIRDGSTLVNRQELPLGESSVEDMFRFVNLRPATGGSSSPATRIGEPSNRPYSTNGISVFLVHGFRVGAEESRGWGSEFFKKLLRSGSHSDFCMVTWNSDPSDGIDYYWAVNNAFLTASNLAEVVNSVPGEKVVLAHSLGNMVVSSAICDHGMNVSKYFALNAAVPSEALEGNLFNVSTNNPLVHTHWVDFLPRTWSACWNELFDENDDRSRLTWRNRFASLSRVLYNYFSSGDEVLQIGPRGLSLFEYDSSIRDYTWQKQELFKGRSVLYGSGWAGWGFGTNISHSVANFYSNELLMEHPIFEPGPDDMYAPDIAKFRQNKILAYGIPALSPPIGISPNSSLPENRNCDMNGMKSNGWCQNDCDEQLLWKHSDIQDIAYFYTHQIFNKIVSEEGRQ